MTLNSATIMSKNDCSNIHQLCTRRQYVKFIRTDARLLRSLPKALDSKPRAGIPHCLSEFIEKRF